MLREIDVPDDAIHRRKIVLLPASRGLQRQPLEPCAEMQEPIPELIALTASPAVHETWVLLRSVLAGSRS